MSRFLLPPRLSLALTAIFAVAALGAACTDDPSSLRSAEMVEHPLSPYVGDVGAVPQPEFVSRPPFDLDVAVNGSFKPGHPLHLSVAAVANFALLEGEVRLTLPQVAAADESGWDVVVMPLNEEFRPHVRVRKPFTEGEKVQAQTTLTIPEPGYYQLIATGARRTDTPSVNLSGGGDVSSRELWIWIDEKGGKLTEHYDTTVFARGVRRQPGPLGSERRPPRVRRKDANITCSLLPAFGSPGVEDTTAVVLSSPCPRNDSVPPIGPPSPPPSATATFKASYIDAGAGSALRPLQGARYVWSVTTNTGSAVASGNGFTASDGSIPGVIDCQGATSERRISVQVYTLAELVSVKRSVQGNELAATHSGSCGGHTDIQTNALMSHLFHNLMKTVDGHYDRFLQRPDRINAVLYDDIYMYYDFLRTELHVAYSGDLIWGEYGVMTAAHEHGHLWQDRKLYQSPANNGLMRYWSRECQRLHAPESASTFSCAVGEAIADWYAVVVREADLPRWKSEFESNHFYRNCRSGYVPGRGEVVCTTDGSIVEGAIAAFLWDITDPSNGEPHDNVYRSASNVTDAIRTCAVRVRGSSNHTPYTGVDHLIWCMETRFPYEVMVRHPTTGRDTVVKLFNTRETSRQAVGASGTSVEPNSNAFRRLWLVNLYSLRPEIGGSPVFYDYRSSLEEPAPDDPGAGPGDGGGGDCGTLLECQT